MTKHLLFKTLLSILIILLFFSSLVLAADYVPQRMSYQGFLTDHGGNTKTGDFVMSFALYDNITGGSNLWDETSITTSVSNGLFSHDLGSVKPLNLTGNMSYYFELTVSGEALGRVNVSQTLWAQRAQQANNLTEANNYAMKNLTVSDKITFALAEFIDNLQDAWLRVNGGLNVTGNLSIDDKVTFANGAVIDSPAAGNVTLNDRLRVNNNMSAERFVSTSDTGLEFPTYQTMWAFTYGPNTPVPNTGIRFNLATGSLDFALNDVNFFSVSSSGDPTFGNGASDVNALFDTAGNDGGFDWVDADDRFNFADDIFLNVGESLFFGVTTMNVSSDGVSFLKIGSSGTTLIDSTGTVNITTLRMDVPTANITALNVFVPQYSYAYTNVTMPVGTGGIWYNVTFQNQTSVAQGIQHSFNSVGNDTFNITQTGTYGFAYIMGFRDSAASPDANIAGRILLNDAEIPGTVFEADSSKQNNEVALVHNIMMRALNAGDKVKLQFASDDTTVSLSSHGAIFGTQTDSASFAIWRVS